MAAIFLEILEFNGDFLTLSFITQFKIELLLLFTGCRKVLGRMLGYLFLLSLKYVHVSTIPLLMKLGTFQSSEGSPPSISKNLISLIPLVLAK